MKTKAEYIDLLRCYFQEKAKGYGVVRMGLFGSVARGEQREDSDVDILYEGEADLWLGCRLKRELEEIMGCAVDIVRYRKKLAETKFGSNILKDLIYV